MTAAFQMIQAASDQQLREIAALANVVWHEHFTPIIGTDQVNYMLEKFQSFPALKQQLSDGYQYYQICDSGKFCGYCGIRPENQKLFLSKLYLRKDVRGKHLASKAFDFLKNFCRKESLQSIWLTCNKHNDNTLAIYKHLGFQIIDTQEADIGNGFVMDDYILEYVI